MRHGLHVAHHAQGVAAGELREDVSTYPALLAALAERGWSGDDLARLTCRNTLRVLREVESVAADLQAERGPSLARIEDLDGVRPLHP